LQIEPDEFRRRYAELSDDALLAIDRKDLTDVARGYYDAEVGLRGIDSPVASGQPEPSPDPELVPAATFLSAHEAELGRELLRGADIPAYLENELTATWTGAGGLRLMVPASFLEQAKEILEAPPISDEDLLAQAEAAEPVDSDPVDSDPVDSDPVDSRD